MRQSRILLSGLVIWTAMVTSGPAATAGQVLVNGMPLPRALAAIDATIDVTEFRDGNDPTIVRLIPGSKRYGVCVLTPDPVAVFDAELPVADTPDRFAIVVEDGREFSGCLMQSLNMVERPPARPRPGEVRQMYKYCLRCENLTVPAP